VREAGARFTAVACSSSMIEVKEGRGGRVDPSCLLLLGGVIMIFTGIALAALGRLGSLERLNGPADGLRGVVPTSRFVSVSTSPSHQTDRTEEYVEKCTCLGSHSHRSIARARH
jgi:hypothetical protein